MNLIWTVRTKILELYGGINEFRSAEDENGNLCSDSHNIFIM
jgi:hypothetical protein